MSELIITAEAIQHKILTIRGCQIILDRDIASLYGVETKALNQAVKRNSERFPEEFMFQLSVSEFSDWKSQFVTSNVSVSIQIMKAFIAMRRFILSNTFGTSLKDLGKKWFAFSRMDISALDMLKEAGGLV